MNNRLNQRRGGTLLAFALTAGTVSVAMSGCSSDLPTANEDALRRSVMDSVTREIREAEAHAETLTLTPEGGQERLGIRPELMPELETMAGPDSYADDQIPMTENLLGLPQGAVAITIEQAVRSAVANNLEVQFARIAPAIGQAQVTQAEAAFDWVLFANSEWAEVEEPRVGTRATRESVDQRDTFSTNFGVRRRLPTGGQFAIQQEFARSDNNSPGFAQVPNPANVSNLTLRFDQPLLRGFGPEVNLAQIRLSQNAERDEVANLRRELTRIVTETEVTYWELVQSYNDLLILQRLLERGITVRDRVRARADLDATPAEVADAIARVERRRTDVVRAQNALREVSDRLKVLMNDPQLTIGSEVLLLPLDEALDTPVSYSLIDAMASALRNRPEIQQAIISLDNTSIRQMLADNERLPQLDLRLQTRLSGMDDDLGGAFQEQTEAIFIDYLVGLAFEYPLGNRGPEALYRQRQLERMQATIAYRNTIQQVLLEVKRSLRNVITAFRLIEQSRVSRLAEAENLRSFNVEIEELRGFNIDLLDLLFRRQESLAQAERDEVAALVDYNTSLAALAAATGTALERNNIDFVVSDAFETVSLSPEPAAVAIPTPELGEELTPSGAPAGEPAPVEPAPAGPASPQE